MSEQQEPVEDAAPDCDHPNGTTLGHEIPPTPMWDVKHKDLPVWFCPDCLRTVPRQAS